MFLNNLYLREMEKSKELTRENKKILQITTQKFPPEIRVAKEAITFQIAGYQSAVLCPQFDDQPEYEIWNNIEIYRPKVLAKSSYAEKVMSLALFFSPYWYSAIRDVISQYKPDVLHVHDVWLGRVVFFARTSQKIVMDLHENMPAAVVEYLKGFRGRLYWIYKLFHGYTRIFYYERKLLNKSNLVLVVVQEAEERVLNDHPDLDYLNVVNIENLESKRFITDPGVGRPAFEKDHFSVLYIGGFGPHRGVDTLIRAMVPIKKMGKKIKVQLIGARPSQYLEMLKQLVIELKVEDQVQITGWVNSEDVLANIQQADLCCVPHHSNPHTDNTIPHKLYQYMISKRPIMVSSSAPLARTVQQAQCGVIFEAGNPEDCCKAILSLVDNPDTCAELAVNGYQYVVNNGHNWEDESSVRLINAYDRLFCKH